MLLKRLIQKKMEDGEDMCTHLADFFDVVGKLENMELNIDKELISILLLYSIPDCYEPFRVAIEAKDKILESKTFKVKMIEEYELRMRRSDGGATSAMFALRNKAGKSKRHNPNSADATNKNKSPDIKCFKCEKTGDLAKQCRKNKQTKKSTGDSTNCAEITMCACENTHHEKTSNGSASDVRSDRKWCVVSGATSHMWNDKTKFSDIRVDEKPR
ncbi:retrovirus-related pol polyprotein from transposon tnt 1-94 [Lasius niger]|uniref:Retrovirus-related pol polyprotein from transposon tnt 1-94 n=1 Tax=Lasius niger TaxID=67767 RepID=A0A0J7JZR3_LASNI|nr:retrovirus-related pol polyprotein from transposon tnt 1-94 [Lasius niger]